MKRIRILAAGALATCLLIAMIPLARAGRVGGPEYRLGVVPAATSVYYDIPFAAGEMAVVTVNGDAPALLYVLLYDADGHVANGVGTMESKTVSMDVYRTGTLRVEVRNMGLRDASFRLTTN